MNTLVTILSIVVLWIVATYVIGAVAGFALGTWEVLLFLVLSAAAVLGGKKLAATRADGPR